MMQGLATHFHAILHVRGLLLAAPKQGLSVLLFTQRSLQLKNKTFYRTITELGQKAAEEAVNNEVLEKLSDLVQEREGIERKLSTTYSLGRDGAGSQSNSLLPLYDGKTKSYSFQSAKKESVTVFHTLSDASSGESSHKGEAEQNLYEDKESASKAKAKEPIEVGSSSDGGTCEEDYLGTPSRPSSSSRGFVNPLFMGHVVDEPREAKVLDDGEVMDSVENSSRNIWTIRLKRRTLSSTN
ncbi:hypothetical protein L1049_007407 [Liquidambar formosana]|uniref:Uncharacterized protein n=1 Tax=Liquidambar formosana TaxID=63359 RepID=A0AAP0R1R4_LIQFO